MSDEVRQCGPATGVRVIEVLGVTLACAVFCDALLAVSLRVEQTAPVFVGPGLIGLGCMWVVALTLFGIIGRLRPTVVLLACSSAGFAAINAVRMDILDIPLSFRDIEFLKDPGFLVDMVGIRVLAAAVAGVVILGTALALLLSRVGRHRRPPRRGQPGWRWWVGFRTASVVSGVVLVVIASGFNAQGNSLRSAYNASGATWKSWSQADNYRANGFFGGLFYNLPVDAMEQPAGYSPVRMAEIAAKWERLADKRNAGTDPDALKKTNVVVVLSETMGDPSVLEHVKVESDPLPRVRRLMEKSGGHMLASYYGSGTSAMEFQVLTGQSLGLFRGQISSPYQQFVTDHSTYPNAAGWLGSLGHRSIAVHPFPMKMYRRPEVYDVFGFDERVEGKDLQKAERLNRRGFISDQSAYDEVLHHMDVQRGPIMVNLVTMQNHMPYPRLYRNPIPVDGVSAETAPKIGQWARGMEYSNKAVSDFLGAVKERDERTIVVQFGDHFPAIFDTDTIEQEGLNLFRTPFFVWDSAGGTAVGDQGDVGATAALEIALRHANIPLPPYFALLAEFQEKVGTVRGGAIITPEGATIAMDELDAEQRELLDELRLVQYDFSIGKRWALADMWYSPE